VPYTQSVTLPNYISDERLGKGGCGTVVKIQIEDRTYALKFIGEINREASPEDKAKERALENEAKIGATLN